MWNSVQGPGCPRPPFQEVPVPAMRQEPVCSDVELELCVPRLPQTTETSQCPPRGGARVFRCVGPRLPQTALLGRPSAHRAAGARVLRCVRPGMPQAAPDHLAGMPWCPSCGRSPCAQMCGAQVPQAAQTVLPGCSGARRVVGAHVLRCAGPRQPGSPDAQRDSDSFVEEGRGKTTCTAHTASPVTGNSGGNSGYHKTAKRQNA